MAAAAAVALAGCEQGPKPVAGICKAFPAANAQPAATDGPGVLEDCLHRWAYTLAGSADDAGTVADAVVAACTGPLARWNQQALGQAAATGQPDEAPSLLTGEATTPIAEHSNFAKGRALFYVVQGRAGGCKPPPRKAGATNSPEA
jgi:hypothetical protein